MQKLQNIFSFGSQQSKAPLFITNDRDSILKVFLYYRFIVFRKTPFNTSFSLWLSISLFSFKPKLTHWQSGVNSEVWLARSVEKIKTWAPHPICRCVLSWPLLASSWVFLPTWDSFFCRKIWYLCLHIVSVPFATELSQKASTQPCSLARMLVIIKSNFALDLI